jgi:mycothiol synthase
MNTPLPAGYIARRPQRDDAPAVAELINACSVADVGLPLVSEEMIGMLWQMPGYDPAADGWLVTTADGTLVGVGIPYTREPYTQVNALEVVHPDHAAHGLAEWLLEQIEVRAGSYRGMAPAGEELTLMLQSWSGNERLNPLLAQRGYGIARVFKEMQIEFEPDTPQPEVTPPAGITLRAFVRGEDEERTWQADQESFADHWNHHETPLDLWTQLTIGAQESFDPTLWWLAMDGEQVAGVALCEASAPGQPEFGYVASLGVRRPWRGRGLAKLLLATAFAEFQRRGKRGVTLGVDAESPTGAHRLYERAGMRPVLDMVVFAKVLGA